MADVRAFLATNDALCRLSRRYGTEEVLEVVKAWAAYIDRAKAIWEEWGHLEAEGPVPKAEGGRG